MNAYRHLSPLNVIKGFISILNMTTKAGYVETDGKSNDR